MLLESSAEQHVIPAGISDSMRIYGYLGATQEVLEQAGEVTDTINVSLILMATLLDPQPGHLGMRHVKACFTYSILAQILGLPVIPCGIGAHAWHECGSNEEKDGCSREKTVP